MQQVQDSAFNAATTGIVAVVTTGWAAVSTATTNAFGAATTGIVAVASAGWGLVKTGIDTVFGKGTGDTITGLVSAGWTAVVTTTTTLLGTGDGSLGKAVSDAWDAIITYVKGLAASGSALLVAVHDVGTGIVQSIQDGINSQIAGFQEWFRTTFTEKIPQWARDVLGIKSPSSVMFDIGVQLVEGLRQGIASRMPSVEELITKAIGSMGGGDVPGELDDWIKAAIAVTGVGEDWLSGLRWLAMHESTGNPKAVNRQAVSNGEHASGLFQTIPSTFARFRDKDLPNEIFNPIANAVAAINYIKKTYGNVGNVISGWAERGGYAAGGWAGLHGPELAWLGERGPEYVVPNSALGSSLGTVATHRLDITIGGHVAEQIYVTGRDIAIRRGRAPAGVV
jgi:hypothetical protein